MKLRSLVLAAFLALPFVSFGQVGISINVAPPIMPVYEQPPCPEPGYIWTPGYWAYDTDYYWVPGVWVAPPAVGLLWTPAWWGWSNGAYVFNQGYWGPTVGFYGGINYGHGYWGDGYWGGHWSGNTFQYNTAVTNVNKTVIHNTYVDRNVMSKNVNHNRAAFNGPNGVKAEATAEQKAAAANANKMGPTSQQLKRQEAASKDPGLQAKNNKGHPNNEAVKSFNKNEGTEHGKAGEGVGAAGDAGAGKGDKNKTGNMAERHGKESGMSGEEHGNKHAGQNNGNKHERENIHGNNHTAEGNQAKMHKGTAHADAAHGQHGMNQQMNAQRHQQQMMSAQHHPQMQGGGNRPKPSGGQQQGKKKEGKH